MYGVENAKCEKYGMWKMRSVENEDSENEECGK